ncbi:MAG: hypothetical protein WCP45_15470 [Verrucomicrobiota bacterium]
MSVKSEMARRGRRMNVSKKRSVAIVLDIGQGSVILPYMICSNNRLLFLRATTDYPEAIITHIQNVCALMRVEFYRHDYQDLDALHDYLHTEAGFDFLYVAAHGAHHCFGENHGGPIARWSDFGMVLCMTGALNPNAVLFMGCCHGGLKKVSLILFSICHQISSICGPRWTVNVGEVPVALHVFLHNLISNKEEPDVAARRAADAIGIAFPFYNRYELEADLMIVRQFALHSDADYRTSDDLGLATCPACLQVLARMNALLEECNEADSGTSSSPP